MRWDSTSRVGATCGTAVFLAFAFFFSLFTISWCEFATFTLVGGRDVSFGLWRYQSFAIIIDGSNQLWKVDTCEGYPDSVDTDAYWKAAQAFSIIAPCLGGILGLLTCFGPELWGKSLGVSFLFVCLCQGLVFLFFKSDACDATKNPLFEEIPSDIAITTQRSCDLGHNSIMGILATCFWLLAATVPFFCTGSPEEFGYDADEDAVDDDKPLGDEEEGEEPFVAQAGDINEEQPAS